MARNRMLKPEFWEDYKFAECSSNARLLFLAMLNFADDEGFLEHNCRWLKVKCLPYDSVKIEPLLDELLKIERIVINNGIIWIKNFLKHQRIDKPNKSSLSQTFNSSTNDRRMIDEHSLPKDKLKEVKLNEDKLSKNSTNVELAATPQKSQYGNVEINKMLEALKAKIEIDDFADTQRWARIYAKNCFSLMGKIGKDEFVRRLDIILNDDFKRKNCNRIKFVYNEIKGFIEPKNNILTIET